MPDSFQGLAVLLLALLPGALYVWSFERQAGSWGVGLSDRVLRFIGVSAVLQVALAPLALFLWRTYVVPGRLAAGDIPLSLWIVPVAYVAVPIAGGWVIGAATRRRAPWARFFTGPAPAPRAWDDLFGSRPEGWMRLKMKSGVWIGGAFTSDRQAGLRAYAAGYPDEQDLFLPVAAIVDTRHGYLGQMERGRVPRVHRDEVTDVPETKKETSIERKGGYPAGERPVSQLTPPPKGPGAGSKPSDNGKQPEKPR